MGLRLRLKASFSLAGYHGQALVVLRALKRYGLIVADNGSSWYITGAPDPRWNDEDLDQLKRVPGVGLRGGRAPGRSCTAAEDALPAARPARLGACRRRRGLAALLGATGCARALGRGRGAAGRGGLRRLRRRRRAAAPLLAAALRLLRRRQRGCCECDSPVTDCLNSRIPLPSERPISGSRLAPNTSSRITTRKAMCSGLSSPMRSSLGDPQAASPQLTGRRQARLAAAVGGLAAGRSRARASRTSWTATSTISAANASRSTAPDSALASATPPAAPATDSRPSSSASARRTLP